MITCFVGFAHFSCSWGCLSFLDLWVDSFHHLGEVWSIVYSNIDLYHALKIQPFVF